MKEDTFIDWFHESIKANLEDCYNENNLTFETKTENNQEIILCDGNSYPDPTKSYSVFQFDEGAITTKEKLFFDSQSCINFLPRKMPSTEKHAVIKRMNKAVGKYNLKLISQKKSKLNSETNLETNSENSTLEVLPNTSSEKNYNQYQSPVASIVPALGVSSNYDLLHGGVLALSIFFVSSLSSLGLNYYFRKKKKNSAGIDR